MKLIYVAHKFGGDLANANMAEAWTAFLNRHIENAIFLCPWLPMVRNWVDSGETRLRGLKLDLECVKRCDGLIALTELTGGVELEWNVATRRYSCPIGPYTSPEQLCPDGFLGISLGVQQWVDSLGQAGAGEG